MKPLSPNRFGHPTILLDQYMESVAPTDRLPQDALNPVLLGLFGEVGGIMTAAKKLRREQEAFAGYRHAVEEEFGDVLWYLCALCRRLGLGLDEVFAAAAEGPEYSRSVAASDLLSGPLSQVAKPPPDTDLETVLLELAEAATGLFGLEPTEERCRPALISFADWYLRALSAACVSFADVAHKNVLKTTGRFLDPDLSTLPTFDRSFPPEERLPDYFEITITQRRSGRSYLQLNGVFIGDPLTDNIGDPDGYRFHDVFHFAHAAILHWSPTFRALIKHKRKSDPEIDEAQDGGRAVVIEEGLTAWIFARAKELDFFDGQDRVSFDVLKTVQQFVSGYEVESCPLRLWEIAIIEGYRVFRQMRQHEGGTVVADRQKRSLRFRPLSGSTHES